MPPKRAIQLIAVADIGAFGAALIERRDQVFGKRFDLAGDELSGEEQARILSRAIGRYRRIASRFPGGPLAQFCRLGARV
jgi:uncharacterized protein YbjT (DUF2867 family)